VRISKWSLLNRTFLIEDGTRVINAMTKRMVMVHFTSKMEGITKDSGKTIRCMVLVSFTMRMERLPTKVIGKMISSMARAEFTTQSQLLSMRISTTRTSLS
jgi:hypothetical protein